MRWLQLLSLIQPSRQCAAAISSSGECINPCVALHNFGKLVASAVVVGVHDLEGVPLVGVGEHPMAAFVDVWEDKVAVVEVAFDLVSPDFADIVEAPDIDGLPNEQVA